MQIKNRIHQIYSAIKSAVLYLPLFLALLSTSPISADDAYVTNLEGSSVSVIDTSTNTITATITVGSFPSAVAITPNGQYVYVANSIFSGSPISVIYTGTNTVVDTVTAGANSSGIAITPNGNYAYVCNSNSANVSVIQTSTNTVVDTITVGSHPDAVAFTPNGIYAYVTDLGSGEVSVIQTSSLTVVNTIPVGAQPLAIAITPNGNYAYVANREDGTVSVIATSTQTVTDTINVGNFPVGLAISPDGTYTYVANQSDGTVSIIEIATNTVTNTVAVGSEPYGIAFTINGQYAYVANQGNNTVSVIETSTQTVIDTISGLNEPIAIAIKSPQPTVTSLNPTYGFPAGGTPVTITGTNFVAPAIVDFGTNPATSVMVISTTEITATSPAGTGIVNVTVTTPTGGTSPISSADAFSYLPAVTGVSPNQGPAAGGTPVTITGTNFVAPATVNFGPNLATSVVVVSPTEITASSPLGSGTVDVTITTTGGTSETSTADEFTYLQVPDVTGVAPNQGPMTGGTPVTITGTNFAAPATVNFGLNPATSVIVVSTTEITATSPAGTGTVDVRVMTAGGTSAISSADQFTYQQVPTVTGVSPNQGPASGGTTITITGTNFVSPASVKFGSTPGTNVTVVSSTEITVTSPAVTETGTIYITVTTPGGTSAPFSAAAFTYFPTQPASLTGKQETNDFGLEFELFNLLQWNAGYTPGIAGYYVYRNGVRIATLSATTFKYEDHHRKKRVITTYTVTSFDAQGNESSPMSISIN